MLCAAGAGERRGDPVSVPSAGSRAVLQLRNT